MLPLSLFRNPDFTGAQISAFAISASLFAVFIYVTLYLQQILGLSPDRGRPGLHPGHGREPPRRRRDGEDARQGLAPRCSSAAASRSSPSAMVDDGGRRRADSRWVVLLPGFIVAMIGTGMFNPAVSNVALSSAPPEQSGLAAGVNDTFRQAGIAVGVAALGALVPAEAALGGGSAERYVDGLTRRCSPAPAWPPSARSPRRSSSAAAPARPCSTTLVPEPA